MKRFLFKCELIIKHTQHYQILQGDDSNEFSEEQLTYFWEVY